MCIQGFRKVHLQPISCLPYVWIKWFSDNVLGQAIMPVLCPISNIIDSMALASPKLNLLSSLTQLFFRLNHIFSTPNTS